MQIFYLHNIYSSFIYLPYFNLINIQNKNKKINNNLKQSLVTNKKK